LQIVPDAQFLFKLIRVPKYFVENTKRSMNFEPETRFLRAFGAWLQTPLTALLRETAAVRWVNQKRLSPTLVSGPAFFYQLSGEDIPPGSVIGFEFEPKLFFSLLDWLQGGEGTVEEEELSPDRPLTLLEKRLASRFLHLFHQAVLETGRISSPTEFLPTAELSRPEFRNFTAAEFRLDAGTFGGTFRLWRSYPHRQLDLGSLDEMADENDAQSMAEALAKTPVCVSVQLSGAKISPQGLLKWRVGDMIELGKPEDHPFTVLVEGMEKFTAAPGKFKSRKAFRIL